MQLVDTGRTRLSTLIAGGASFEWLFYIILRGCSRFDICCECRFLLLTVRRYETARHPCFRDATQLPLKFLTCLNST